MRTVRVGLMEREPSTIPVTDELPRPSRMGDYPGPMFFWALALIGGVLLFFQGYEAASANAEVCTRMGDELIGCDSGPATMLLSLGVIGIAGWRLYANWKKPPGLR